MLLDYYQKGVRFFTLLIGESEPSPILSIFASAPPRQIGTFKVTTEYPSMNLVGLNYAIGFDVKGAGELACEMGVFFGQNDDLTNSEKYLRYACQWDSNVGKYHYNLAYCLGKQGKYQEALEELDIASTLKPADDSISRLKEQLEEALSDSAKSIID
jgi:tetratricopeptide (TPR) repeat protein